MQTKISLVAALSALAFGSFESRAVSFDYSSFPTGQIVFDGASHFSFSSSNPLIDLQIDTGSAQGFFGEISGTFTIGAIVPDGTGFSAPVTGTGLLSIFNGGTLTADLSWDRVFQKGTGSTLNVNGAINLSNIIYNGANADLVALAAAGSGVNVLTFQFIPARTLNSLKNNPGSTSFSGTIVSTNVPDGGATALLLGIGIAGLGLATRRKQ